MYTVVGPQTYSYFGNFLCTNLCKKGRCHKLPEEGGVIFFLGGELSFQGSRFGSSWFGVHDFGDSRIGWISFLGGGSK